MQLRTALSQGNDAHHEGCSINSKKYFKYNIVGMQLIHGGDIALGKWSLAYAVLRKNSDKK